jgi:post-segregation antitoxin (ccd killing protein)
MTKPITISVPDNLSEELKKFPEIKVSAVCQEALKNKLEDLKSQNNKDDDLLAIAEKRFKKQLIRTAAEYKKICEEAGARWAAEEASFEDLKFLTEERDLAWQAFSDSGCVAKEIYNRYEEDGHDLYDSFVRGALNLFEKIKKRMKEQGFSEFS